MTSPSSSVKLSLGQSSMLSIAGLVSEYLRSCKVRSGSSEILPLSVLRLISEKMLPFISSVTFLLMTFRLSSSLY